MSDAGSPQVAFATAAGELTAHLRQWLPVWIDVWREVRQRDLLAELLIVPAGRRR